MTRANGANFRLRASRTGGFTLFELMIVIVLVAVFSGVLLDRFLYYQELAEKTAMEQTAGAVRSALNIQAAGLIARGRAEELQKLLTVNPMRLMTEAQKNYAGEFFDVTPADVPPGSWYYDLKRGQLVYVVRNGAHFEPGDGGERIVRYKVGLAHNDWLKEIGNPASAAAAGIVLSEVQPYRWPIN